MIDILKLEINDTAKARIQDSNGNYHYRETDGLKINSQEQLLDNATKLNILQLK